MNTKKTKFEYHAFISYNHANSKAALKLHAALERIRSSRKIKKLLYPVFIDKHGMLGGAYLNDDLNEKLDKSKFLVVVCTQESVGSKTVNEEISYFRSLPQGKNIIPVILDEYEKVDADVFPPSLEFRAKNTHSLAINLGGDSAYRRKVDRHSLMKIAAPIAGVSLDVLWSRERMRQKKMRAFVALFCCFIMVSLLLYWDFYHRQFDDKYKNFYRSPYGWVGVQGVVHEKGDYYLFKRKGRLGNVDTVWFYSGKSLCDRHLPMTNIDTHSLRLAAINQSDQAVLRLCKAEFSYHLNGQIDTEALLSSTAPNGMALQFLESFRYPLDICENTDVFFSNTKHCSGDFRTQVSEFKIKVAYDKNKLSKISALQTGGLAFKSGDSLSSGYIRYFYDDLSRLNGAAYLNFDQKLVGKLKLYYNESNLAGIRVWNYESSNFIGLAFDEIEFDYDANGRLVKRKLFKNDKLTISPRTYSIGHNVENDIFFEKQAYVGYEYLNDNEFKIRFFNNKDQPMEFDSVHSILQRHNNGDFKWFFLGLTEESVEDSAGVHKSISSNTIEDKQRVSTRSWYGIAGDLVIGPSGYAKSVFYSRGNYSAEGLSKTRLSNNMLSNRYLYDEELTLIENSEGIAYLNAKYDDKDRISELALYDSEEKLIENSIGIAKVIWNEKSNVQECFSADGDIVKLKAQRIMNTTIWEPIDCAKENLIGYSMIVAQRYYYHDPDKIKDEIYARGSSLSDRQVTAYKAFEYKEGGIIIEKVVDFLVELNTQMKNIETRKVWNGPILLEEAFYDRDTGERVNNQNGYSFARYEIQNSVSNRIQIIRFYDRDENPIREPSTGSYSMKNKFDAQNRIEMQSFYDSDSNPRAKIYYSLIYEYLDGGQSMRAAAYTASNELFIPEGMPENFAATVYTDRNNWGLYSKKYIVDHSGVRINMINGIHLTQLESDPSGQFFQVARKEDGSIVTKAPFFSNSILAW